MVFGKLRRDARGVTTIEYGLLVGLIGIGFVTGAESVATSLASKLGDVEAALTQGSGGSGVDSGGSGSGSGDSSSGGGTNGGAGGDTGGAGGGDSGPGPGGKGKSDGKKGGKDGAAGKGKKSGK